VNKVGETSAGLALKLISSGYTKVYALKGGWKE
jgi:rhodanese-related sulfurtransferase